MMSGVPKLRLLSLILAVLCAVAAALPVPAHHSQGMYDLSAWTTMEGTVRQVRWSNPHAWVFLDVEDEQGQVQTWALEGAMPNDIRGAALHAAFGFVSRGGEVT